MDNTAHEPQPAAAPAAVAVVEPPENEEQYVEWAKNALGVDFTAHSVKNRCETNIQAISSAFQQTDFYNELTQILQTAEEEYAATKGSGLLMSSAEVSFVTKPYESVINKSFRKNILENEKFPSAPEGGWVTPGNWYCRMNDLLRARIVCKFIDGPGFVTERLISHAENKHVKARAYTQQRDEGYYAYHFYVTSPFGIMDEQWNEQINEVEIEVQITTQLQDVLNKLTHMYYEEQRISSTKDSEEWKWEYGTSRFRARYLSHTLHMLEGIIVELRDGSLKKGK